MTQEQGTSLVPASDGRLSFGQTNLRPQDIVPPRVKVVQQMSAEAQGGKDAQAQPGDFYNTLTGQNMGDKITVQPIITFMQRILLVRKEKRDRIEAKLSERGIEFAEGDGLMCRSYDMVHGRGSPGVECETECPLSQWDEIERRPPLCTETYNVAAMDEYGGLVVLSFQKSSAKVGKRLFSAMRMRPGHPWTSLYTFRTRSQQNDLGTFYVPDFVIDKEPPASDQIAGAFHWAQQLQGVVIDVSPEDEESGGGGAGADGEAPF